MLSSDLTGRAKQRHCAISKQAGAYINNVATGSGSQLHMDNRHERRSVHL